MPTPRKWGGGVMDGAGLRGMRSDLQARWIPGGGRHPGFRKNATLRGAVLERGPRLAHEDGGSIQPSGRRASDPIKKGCSRSSSEEGNLAHTVLRQQAVPGVVLCSGQLGPCSPALSSNVHRRKRWTGRGAARKRRRDGAVVFVRCFAAFCSVVGPVRKDCRGS